MKDLVQRNDAHPHMISQSLLLCSVNQQWSFGSVVAWMCWKEEEWKDKLPSERCPRKFYPIPPCPGGPARELFPRAAYFPVLDPPPWDEFTLFSSRPKGGCSVTDFSLLSRKSVPKMAKVGQKTAPGPIWDQNNLPFSPYLAVFWGGIFAISFSV